MPSRISTLSTPETDGFTYTTGDLSVFPELLDDKKTLYTVKNNAESKLKQSLSYNGKYIILEDASSFPPYGLVRLARVGSNNFETIYYDKRNDTTLMGLIRGFCGSRQDAWPSSETTVSNAVLAEVHNATKDAILNIERDLGTKEFPDDASLNGLLKALEVKHLAPKALFRAFPLKGIAPLNVRFQNFSNSESIRFLWDFGDGTTSDERSPTHVYQTDGIYTVRLNIIMTTGAQGFTIKSDYITVASTEITPFFYVSATDDPNTYEFVDQTDGDIAARYWVFDDGESEQILDPNDHTTTHTYEEAGSYIPSLLIVFKDQSLKRVFLKEGITIT